jgi:hypothetical protein
MIKYILWWTFIEVPYVRVIKLNDNIKLSWLTYWSTSIFQQNPRLHWHICPILAQFLYSLLRKVEFFYLTYSLSPLFLVLMRTTKLTVKTLGTVRVSCDTTEAVNFHEDKIADRYLLSNLPTINVWSCWSLQSLWSSSL